MDICVKKIAGQTFTLDVPASKSILSRALVLAAFTEGETFLQCGDLGEDSLAMLRCLRALGVSIEAIEGGLLVHGRNKICRDATLNVGESGTAARFLTAVLAFSGGDFFVDAAAQMRSRPMQLSLLEQCGASFEFPEETGRLPFRMHAEGFVGDALTCDTSVSTQFASGLMLAAAIGTRPLNLRITGDGASSAYLTMTAKLIERFGGTCERTGDLFRILPVKDKPLTFCVEPDVSAACTFYALALLCRAKVAVRGVSRESIQGDTRFFDLLEARGVRFSMTDDGLAADAREVASYRGFDEDIGDIADQAPNLAALAVFASTPSRFSGLSRSRYKESDRIATIEENMHRLEVACTSDEKTLFLTPGKVQSGRVSSFGDHRIAMAFALIGARTGGVTIEDALCCRKTFSKFFDVLGALT